MCRRDAGGEDQVGSPSLAGPSILEPARGRGAQRVGSPAAPQPTPGCLHSPPGTMSPISRSLRDTAWGECSGETDPSPLQGQPLPASTLPVRAGAPGPPLSLGRSPPSDFTPALFLAPCHPTGKGLPGEERGCAGEVLPEPGGR